MEIFTRNLVRHHLFADDKQLYQSGKISEIDNIRHRLCRWVTEIPDKCPSRRLQLNALETELQWFVSRAEANLPKLSSADLTLSVRDGVIQPVTVELDPGVRLTFLNSLSSASAQMLVRVGAESARKPSFGERLRNASNLALSSALA